MAHAYVNGKIYTVNPKQPWAEALLEDGGELVVVGSNADVLAASPAETTVTDLNGRMAMPGLHDAHTHLLFSGLKFRHEARLTSMAGPETIVHDLQQCCLSMADESHGWIVGGEFNSLAFTGQAPDKTFLDEAYPDRPVFLWDSSIHHGLANSKALELAGLSAVSADPAGGRFVRRPDTGELTGELVETATWPVLRAIPDYADEVYKDALLWAIGKCNSFGITSLQEASATRQELLALRALDAEKLLPLRVAAHLVWREERFGMGSVAELDRLIEDRAEYQTAHVDTRFVKLWLDGAPTPPHFTDARLDEHGHPDEGALLFEEKDLIEALKRFDAAGLHVKVHGAGAGAARAALDASEKVREANGHDGTSHEIAHCTFVDGADQRQFAELGVIAEMSPAVWHLPEFVEIVRGGYQFDSLRRAGAALTVGSDWIITPNPNLFPAIQGMLRRDGESVDLEFALRAVTIAGAEAVGLAHRQGTLEPGKSADFIVLDRDLFSIPVDDIGDTQVLRTVFEGRVVHDAEGIAQPV